MGLRSRCENALMSVLDAAYAVWPRGRPPLEVLRGCRLVAHRGEHDGRRVPENTLAAFEAAAAAGVWGIEFDIRWTRDLQPVVVHDPDLRRVFGLGLKVAEASFEQLRRRCPQVPALAEVVARFGGRLHLMVEVKQEPWPAPERQNRRLAEILSPLAAGRDYHFLSLTPEIFSTLSCVPRACCFPIARTRVTPFSRLALDGGFAGLFGHYLLITDKLVAEHHRRGQQVGTGYIGSPYCLFRELARGVDFIFSNTAARMQQVIAQLAAEAPAAG